ncbi:MAG: alpha-L-fucosidase C-terminal domain-containing protein, partial [Candidatus Latescibacterota bacterium]|nr:alpha-L-fucosidase C-terminal domain-containing protein [Candidatus Latescibacterota bacterium]
DGFPLYDCSCTDWNAARMGPKRDLIGELADAVRTGPTAVESGSFTDTKRQGFTSQDIRFTTKGDALYALLMAWPENGETTIQTLALSLRVYTDEIAAVELLGSDAELKWSRTARGLKVKLPEEKPCDHACALKITPKL